MTLLEYLKELMELKVENKMRYIAWRGLGQERVNWKCIGLISVIESMALDELLNVIVGRKWKKFKK